MAPIRVGIIGLSASAAGVGWAASAHLPYLQASKKFELVALCNSSKQSAEKAIAHFKLPEATKAYGDPKDMAQDENIDLVVCCTAVGHHYDMLLPFLEAGKDCYTEVPLAVNIAKSRELQAVAEKKGVRTMIGMQGQANPAVNAVKKIIEDGKIGKVLTTTITGYAAAFTGEPSPKDKVHLFNRAAGANMMTVWFLHTFNFVLHVMGELESYESMLATVHPKIDVFDASDPGKKTTETLESDTPDQIFIQGRFSSGALLSFHVEGGDPFPGDPALKWHIVGEKGELMITNNLMMLDVMHKGAKILFFDYSQKPSGGHDFLNKKGDGPEPTVIQLPEDEMAHLQGVAPNVGRLYEAFADGQTSSYADWNIGLRRHELIEELFERWDGPRPFGEVAEYRKRSG